MTRVVDKFIMELEVQLSERNVTIELTDEAREWLGRKGYDRNFGARPLSRVIQEHIKRPLSEELLFGKLVSGGLARVRIEDNLVAFDFPETPKPRRKGGPKGGKKGKGTGLSGPAGRSPEPAVLK